MKRFRRKAGQEELSRQRAQAIIEVRSGKITATEGARRLGISRKTYYQWESRGLEGMMEALEKSSSGRPEKEADPEKDALRKKVHQMEQELLLEKQANQVKSDFLKWELEKARDRNRAGSSKKNQRR